jgi:very-short-patch-repair endonuclease
MKTSARIGGRRDAEQTIMALARSQHGVVSRAQLLAAGVPADQVDRRVGAHRLRPLQRGVYLVGPLMVPLAQPMSAVLSCGAAAVVSHRSAAMLWQLLERSDPTVGDPAMRSGGTHAVDVTIPPGDRRRRPGVCVHRIELHPDELTRLETIPLTTPTRTLYDRAGHMAERDLERAVAEALSRRLTCKDRLDMIVKRYARRAGAIRLGALLGSGQPPALTRSAAEESLLSLIRKAQLPPPEVNVRIHGYEVDFYWRAERLVTEMDGFAFHASRRSFEGDRRRDAVLAAAGMRVMRVTSRQLEREPEALLARLAQALVRSV